jgi:KaiC
VNGAARFGEPGVFMSFEERAADLAANVHSLGYDLEALIASAGQGAGLGFSQVYGFINQSNGVVRL